jgi:hypothetical protein
MFILYFQAKNQENILLSYANPKESRKEWMLNIFAEAGKNNSNNFIFNFDK